MLLEKCIESQPLSLLGFRVTAPSDQRANAIIFGARLLDAEVFEITD